MRARVSGLWSPGFGDEQRVETQELECSVLLSSYFQEWIRGQIYRDAGENGNTRFMYSRGRARALIAFKRVRLHVMYSSRRQHDDIEEPRKIKGPMHVHLL